jgi:hypothetical protein
LARIDRVLQTKPPMSAQLRKELDALRGAVKAAL